MYTRYTVINYTKFLNFHVCFFFFFLLTEARSFELYIKHAFSCEGIVAKELISLCLPPQKEPSKLRGTVTPYTVFYF